MADLSWMLNAKAMAAAKACIVAVEQELSIRLKLSHPDFLEDLLEYADIVESLPLKQAMIRLARYAPQTVKSALVGGIVGGGSVERAENDSSPTVTDYDFTTMKPWDLADTAAQTVQHESMMISQAFTQALSQEVPESVPVMPEEMPERPAKPVQEEKITYKGREYVRYRNGLEFKGLYRGQPIYR
ncbi:MAG: hypothetical protein P8144_10990 [Gammaproteobacteria bacterium]